MIRNSQSNTLFPEGIDLSTFWYTVNDSTGLQYTPLGLSVYGPLFSGVDIDIGNIKTIDEHKAAVALVTEKRLQEASARKRK